jgi:hypothetical protein
VPTAKVNTEIEKRYIVDNTGKFNRIIKAIMAIDLDTTSAINPVELNSVRLNKETHRIGGRNNAREGL